jgi:hypothetical protein
MAGVLGRRGRRGRMGFIRDGGRPSIGAMLSLLWSWLLLSMGEKGGSDDLLAGESGCERYIPCAASLPSP